MIKAIIIDDEPLACAIITEYLKDHDNFEIIAQCGDGFEGVKAINERKPDLIFLDVQMPKLNGFEMLELLDSPPPVIFTTAYDEYAMKAFEAHAIDYLLKPFSKERFDKAIKKWTARADKPETESAMQNFIRNSSVLPDQYTRIAVKTGTRIRIIPVIEIHYFEADDDYVKICTADGSYLKNKTMSYFENILDKTQFVRVHRSFLLHINQVTRIEPYEKDGHIVVLKSGVRIPVSKTGYPKLKTVLGI